ncbi:MAG TPA: methyl-accepting chemotaxis protein [Lachnospiraceae bacterium]|nr:methyl-accepting chemotaxis protein [Lachnospiraceae bacterium]
MADYVVYFIKKDGNLFRFVSIIGYAAIYGIALINAKSDTVFTMAFPIMVMYVLYFDTLFMGIISGVLLVLNIVSVVMAAVSGSMPSGIDFALSSALLQAATIGVTGSALTWITHLEKVMKGEQMNEVKSEKEKSEQILSDVLALGNTVKENTNKADALMEELNDATTTALETLKAVADSNNDNAKNIESQTVMTSNIQEMIITADSNASRMERIAGDSLNMVSEGRKLVEKLDDKASNISAMNEQVMNTINEFVKNAIEVRGITDKINGISSQTNLLSLNASIESARAGEAGRGFAVVADEIRNLADETKTLTAEINGIVETLENNASGTKETVSKVVESIEDEKVLIDDSMDTYVKMEDMFKQLYESVTDTQKQLKQIVDSNNAIVDSINQLSAASEEVAASMDMAVELSNNNMAKTKEAGGLMEEIVTSANQLDKYNNYVD